MTAQTDKSKDFDIAFGISSTPLSTINPNYLNALDRIIELGLDAFELPFGRIINMSEEGAIKFKSRLDEIKNSTGLDIKISVHAPYYINLNASEDKKKEDSINRIIKSAERGFLARATNIVFHPGFYLKDSTEDTYTNIRNSLKKLIDLLNSNLSLKPILRIETTGKPNQFGELDEVLELSSEFEELLPCADFAHLHARSNGFYNSADEFDVILTKIDQKLGKRGIENMHIHYSGIEYTEKGERRHLPIKESDANYEDLIKCLKDFKVKGNIICESPMREYDALILKEIYLNYNAQS